MRLTLAFYYLVKKETNARERKENEQYWNNCLKLPYGLLCDYNSTYTNLYSWCKQNSTYTNLY